MAIPLSPNTEKAIEKLFPKNTRKEAVRLLTDHCADNLPNCKHEDEYSIEDLRFQVLKLSQGNLEKLRDAIHLAGEDWRDLGVKAGSIRKYKRDLLGADLERNIHSDHQKYGTYLTSLMVFVAFVSAFTLSITRASTFMLGGVLLTVAGANMARFFAILWKDLDFRKQSGVRGVVLMMLLATAGWVGIPAIIGIFLANVLRSQFL